MKPASAAFAVVRIQLAKHRKTVCKRPDAPFGAGFVAECGLLLMLFTVDLHIFVVFNVDLGSICVQLR
jgi:hypothetical protein